MRRFGALFTLAVVACSLAQAPEPGPEMKKLAVFDGEWVGIAKHHIAPDAPPQVTDATMSIGYVMGGMFQRMKYDTEMPGAGKIDGLILTGWDAGKKAYRSWNYNNFIPQPILEIANFEGEAMVGKSEPMDMGMGPMVEHSRMWLKGKNELFVKIEAEMDGRRTTMVELELKRK
jgi:hypothetical protein